MDRLEWQLRRPGPPMTPACSSLSVTGFVHSPASHGAPAGAVLLTGSTRGKLSDCSSVACMRAWRPLPRASGQDPQAEEAVCGRHLWFVVR